jgi:hypothetical protein
MILSIFMSINVFSLCLIGLSSDGSSGLQKGPKKFFSPGMYSSLVAHSRPILKKLNWKIFFQKKLFLKNITLKAFIRNIANLWQFADQTIKIGKNAFMTFRGNYCIIFILFYWSLLTFSLFVDWMSIWFQGLFREFSVGLAFLFVGFWNSLERFSVIFQHLYL